jgi:hypothetical protein
LFDAVECPTPLFHQPTTVQASCRALNLDGRIVRDLGTRVA